MRIRSIRPEFWTSEDIASLTWAQRLIYIGLWSYVDDNGVGRDVEKLIAADLFPLEDDTQAVLMQIAGALSEYSSRQMVTRYEVAGKRYLHINAWSAHQKINRPSDGRYPLPTREDAVIHDILTEPSLSPHEEVALGEGEKGRRGEGEKEEIIPRKRGQRLDPKWVPSEETRSLMADQCPSVDLRAEHDKFIDYWTAKAGRDATKLDWDATWRNWIRNAKPAHTNGTHKQVATANIVTAAVQRARERDAARDAETNRKVIAQ
jgi:hypothetical protein